MAITIAYCNINQSGKRIVYDKKKEVGEFERTTFKGDTYNYSGYAYLGKYSQERVPESFQDEMKCARAIAKYHKTIQASQNERDKR